MDTNTDTYGMIKRVRHLQKAIISKSAEVETKDDNIQDKEKLYVNLRKVLARQPGSETAEQLRLYAATLREKQGKFKQMNNELTMYQTRVYEYKYELQKINQDMKLVKLEYFHRRRKELADQRDQELERERMENGDSLMEDDEDDIGTYTGVPPTQTADLSSAPVVKDGDGDGDGFGGGGEL